MQPDKSHLPKPICDEKFFQLRSGIYDDSDISVWINEKEDFAFLSPIPKFEYNEYQPRHKKLNLSDYKRESNDIEKRISKIISFIDQDKFSNFLEIGCGNGDFLSALREIVDNIEIFAIEPDQNTREARDNYEWLNCFENLDKCCEQNFHFGIIALFHVFEHLEEPNMFLKRIKSVFEKKNILILEVPSLNDPLLSLYSLKEYENFYFQRQHPFIYSANSLSRLLSHEGFTIKKIIPHQRYGLENHLNWLVNKKPGGSSLFKKVFAEIDNKYRTALEVSQYTDTMIIVASY